MVTTMPDNCLLHWLQRLEDYPFTSKVALSKMYGYFKVNENDIGDENSSSTATDQSGSGDVDDTSGGIASVQSDTGAGNTGTNQNVDDSATLLKLIQADDQMHCFLTFRKEEGGESTALLFHHMARYPSRLGENSPFAGSWYVTGGQPVGGVHITYDVPLDLFGVTSPMQAYTVDRTQRELANDITLKTLIPEPTTENVVDIELISTRRSMWIPNQYAALCVEEDMAPVIPTLQFTWSQNSPNLGQSPRLFVIGT